MYLKTALHSLVFYSNFMGRLIDVIDILFVSTGFYDVFFLFKYSFHARRISNYDVYMFEFIIALNMF